MVLWKNRMLFFESSGLLKYSADSSEYKLVVEIDQGIVNYYRSLIPLWKATLNKQKYPPHISVVRKESLFNIDLWGKHEGEKISFSYSNHIYNSANF